MATKKAATKTDRAPVNAKTPPKPKSSGEQIKLDPLTGRLVALKCVERRTVETKFGEREMSDVCIVTPGPDGVLMGVLFASYFQTLEIGSWYIGRIARTAKGVWFMEPAKAGADESDIELLQDRMEYADEEMAEDLPF